MRLIVAWLTTQPERNQIVTAEPWTHKTAAGTRCRIISQDKDRVLIQQEDSDGYWNYRYSRLVRIQEVES
jgi:predicted secreted protein